MTEGVFIAVSGNLGIAGRARGEEHEHWIVAAGGIGSSGELIRAGSDSAVEVMPALTRSIVLDRHEDLGLKSGALDGCEIDLMRDVSVSGCDDCLDSGGIEAVLEVMVDELICSGDDYCAELVESDDREPELIVAFQNNHDAVALFDAERFQIVGGHRGISGHIAKCETVLGLISRKMEHCELVRVLFSDCVDDVESKVELIFALE